MNILHICSDYAKQHLYRQLVLALEKHAINQKVFVPVRTTEEIGGNRHQSKISQLFYKNILRKSDRIFFNKKISKVTEWIESENNDWNEVVIHAHFLYSDGAVALKLHEKYNVPYIVCVRNTDLNLFAKYRPDLKWQASKILKNARSVVFLNMPYVEQARGLFPFLCETAFKDKCYVIPNGLDDFWLERNRPKGKRFEISKASPLQILFVGDDTKNKNFEMVISAISEIGKSLPVELNVVGRRIDEPDRFPSHVKIHQLGKVGREELAKQYDKSALLLVPSIHETFGLVYLEALINRVMVIHSKGQGISGYFGSKHGAFEVDPNNLHDICAQIETAISATINWAETEKMLMSEFSWESVSQKIINAYSKF